MKIMMITIIIITTHEVIHGTEAAMKKRNEGVECRTY